MLRPPLSSLLCLAALAAACGGEATDLTAPSTNESPAAGVSLPAVTLSTPTLYYCYSLGNRMCVLLKRRLRISSTAATARKWSATSHKPWIVVWPVSGTTPTTVTVSIDVHKLPSNYRSRGYLTGLVTVIAPRASNSPQTARVRLGRYLPN